MRQFIFFIGALSSITTFANEGRHVFNLNPGDIKVAPVTTVSGSITPVVRSSAPPSSKGLAAATLGTALSPTTSAPTASTAPVAISAPVPSASTPPAAAPAKSGDAAAASAQQAAGAAGEAAAAAKNAEQNAAAAQQEANNANQRANNAEQANADLRRLLLDNNRPQLTGKDFAKRFQQDQELIERINASKDLSEEQKKNLIANIESTRDKLAEQNGLGRELAELKSRQASAEAEKAIKDAQAKGKEAPAEAPAPTT